MVNEFYNAIQQLRAQKQQETLPVRSTAPSFRPIQTPELDRARGNTIQPITPIGSISQPAQSGTTGISPGLQSTLLSNLQQSQQTEPEQEEPQEERQSTTSRFGRTHSRRTSTEAASVGGNTDSKSQLEQMSEGGRVDLSNRARVSSYELNALGWDVEPGTTAITPVQTYTVGDKSANFTPVRVDERGALVGVLTPEELEEYAKGVISGKRNDDWNLLVGYGVQGNEAAAKQAAEQAQIAQREYYSPENQGTFGQRAGAFASGLFGKARSRDEVQDLPQGIRDAYLGGAGLYERATGAPAAAQTFLDNAIASFGNPSAKPETAALDPEWMQNRAIAGQMTGLALGQGALNYGAGVANAIQFVEDLYMKGYVHDKFTENILAQRDAYAAKIKKETADWTEGQKRAYGLAIEAVRMLPSIAMGAASAAGQTVAQAGAQIAAENATSSSMLYDYLTGLAGNPFFYDTAIQETGNSYEYALNNDADRQTAATFAVMNGLLNAMIEVGGVQQVMPELKNKQLHEAVWDVLKQVPGEAREEVLQGIIEKLLGNVVLGEDHKIFSVKDKDAIISLVRMLEEGEGAAALTLFMGGSNIALNAAMGAYRNNPRAQEARQMQEQQQGQQAQAEANEQTEEQQTPQEQEQLTPIAQAVLGEQAETAPVREEIPTIPGTDPRAAEQAQLEETLNTPQAPVSEVSPEAQEQTSPVAEAVSEPQDEGFTGESGMTYTKEQLDALAALSAEALVTGAEENYVGISAEQVQALRDAGLIQTGTDENGNTFEYLPSEYINDERARRNAAEAAQTPGEQTEAPAEQTTPANNPREAEAEQIPTQEPEAAMPAEQPTENAEPVTPEETEPRSPLIQPRAPGIGSVAEQAAEQGGTRIQTVDRGANPNGNLEGTKLSQTAETVQNARPTPEDFAALMGREKENGAYRYFPITNDGSVEKATQYITENGWQGALRNWQRDVNRGVAGDQMTTIGALLYNNAVNTGDTKLAEDILADYMTMGRNTARGLQAMRIIKDLDPSTRLYAMLGSVKKLSEKYAHDPDAIQINSDMAERYRTAATEEERDAVIQEIQQDLAKQITEKRTRGVALREMWTALRYVNMLGNFRTQARNILGNTAMAATTTLKNQTLYIAERLAQKATKGAYQPNTDIRVGDYMDAAKADGRSIQSTILGEQKYGDTRTIEDEMSREAENQHRIFASNNRALNTLLTPLEGYRRATNWAMEAGDKIFSIPRYARTLSGYVKAHGMDAATFNGIINGEIEATPEQSKMLDEARQYAVRETQEATFRDTNTISEWVSKIGRRKDTPKAFKMLAEGVLPFRKTPANVAVRAEEYSPLGWVNTIAKGIQAKNGNATASEVLNSAAKSLTGTGIFLLGMLLRSAGWVTGTEDDDKQRRFNDLQGGQEYALDLPGGQNITLDWISPSSIPFFMGVQFMDAINDGGFQAKDFEAAVRNMSDPLIQMSMLQGVNDTLNNVKYSDNNLIQIATQSALSYLGQGLTNTAFGQIERIGEDKRYSTWRNPENKGLIGTADSWWSKASAKNPFYDRNQIEYVDAWGRPEYTGNAFERTVNNLVNPGYMSKYDSTEVDDELQRLYDEGMSNVFPQTTSMTDTLSTFNEHGQKDGERYMDKDEYVTYQKIRGQTSLEMVKDLMDSPVYNVMTDEARAEAISGCYSYAKNMAAQEVEPTTQKEYSDISATSNPAAYIGVQKAFSKATSDEWNRDYESVDALMSEMDNLPKDVRELLTGKNSTLNKVYTASKSDIGSEVYFTAKDTCNEFTAKDENGQTVSGLKKQRVVEYIDSLPLTTEQKIVLFQLMPDNYSLKDTPWA